ncbi:unnamed protein product [Caenorhabditis brenneri]
MTTEHPIVKLNIGGTVFQTTKSTLTKFDGMFKVMMETDIPVIKDKTGAIFIDRDPYHFRLILNFMRDGVVALPESDKEINEIHKEANYYLLDGLVKLCEQKLEPVENPTKMKFIEKDSELLEILQKATKLTLVFHCPVNSIGVIQYPCRFNINDFLEKMKDKVDTYFKPYQHESSDYGLKWDYTVYGRFHPILRTVREQSVGFQEHLEKNIDRMLQYKDEYFK